MESKTEYTKLSALVDSTFTVEKVGEYVFKKWDDEQRKMLTSLNYEEGYRKLYPVTTDKGQLDMGSGQLGSLLEPVFHAGKADIIGVTYAVKSNGQEGINIRYYFNPVKKPAKPTNDVGSYETDDYGVNGGW